MRRFWAALPIVAMSSSAVVAEPSLPTQGTQSPPAPTDVATPLLAAAANGNVAEIRRLHAAGADLRQRDGGGRTPLHVAVHAGKRDAVAALLDLGADPNALDGQRYD